MPQQISWTDKQHKRVALIQAELSLIYDLSSIGRDQHCLPHPPKPSVTKKPLKHYRISIDRVQQAVTCLQDGKAARLDEALVDQCWGKHLIRREAICS